MNNPAKSSTVGFDTETFLIRPSLIAPPMVCLSWASSCGGAGLLRTSDAKEWFVRNIQDLSLTWVGHNVAYDMAVMVNECPSITPFVFLAYLEGRVRDTALREALILNAFGKFGSGVIPSLADLTKKYLNRDRSADKKGFDKWRLRYNELADINVKDWPSEARSYALDDAQDTLGVMFAQQSSPVFVNASGRNVNLILRNGFVMNEREQVQAAFALQLMTVRGLKVDQKAAVELQGEYQKTKDRIGLELASRGVLAASGKVNTKYVKERIIAALTKEATDEHRNAVEEAVLKAEANHVETEAIEVQLGNKKKPGNWSATKEHVATVKAWKKQGFAMPVSKTGRIKTGAEILETIEDADIELLVQYDKADNKLKYLEPMIQAGDNALCPGYQPLKRSGRTSSTGPNIQNPPRSGGVRECFVPRDGYLFVAADYSTVELRAWAQVCLDLDIRSEMAVALLAGRDLHSDLGAQMLNVTYKVMLSQRRGEAGPDVKKRADTFRGAAKPANFGLPVGMGAAKFEESARKSYGVDFKELGVTAKEVRDAWYQRWTEAYPYFAHIKRLLRKVGVKEVVDEDGNKTFKDDMRCAIQHPRSGRVRGGCMFTDAANSYFQGMAADGAKLALFWVAMECYTLPESPLFGSRPVAFIHDEIIIEAPAEDVQKAARRLSDVMVEAMDVYIPDIPIICEADIMDRWGKSHESRTLPDGSLSVYWFEVEKLRYAGLSTEAEALQAQLESETLNRRAGNHA